MRGRRDQVITYSHGRKDSQAFSGAAESGLDQTMCNEWHNCIMLMFQKSLLNFCHLSHMKRDNTIVSIYYF